MPHFPHRRRWAGSLALLATLGLALSCRDSVAPVSQLTPEARFNTTPPPFTTTFGVTNDTTPGITVPLNAYPESRFVKVEISGTMTAANKFGFGAPRTFGPKGWDCDAGVSVHYAGTDKRTKLPLSSNCPVGSTESIIDTILAGGQGSVTRHGIAGAEWRCGNDIWSEICFHFTGTQQVTVSVIDYPATLWSWNGTYRTTITAGTSLYFNWTPDTVVSNSAIPTNVPKATYNWWFQPSDGSTSIANPIQYGYNNQPWAPPKSGTMYVKVKLNGIEKTLSRYIHVGEPTLSLTATPSTVPKGDTVKFEARVLPESTTVSAVSWWWFKTGSPSDSLQVCNTAFLTCVYAPDTSGTMRLRATLAGKAKTASAQVTVTKPVKLTLECTPGTAARGDNVTCTLRSVGGRPFGSPFLTTVTGAGVALVPLSGNPSGWALSADRTQATLEGPRAFDAIIATQVFFDPDPGEALGRLGVAEDTILVTKRANFPSPVVPSVVHDTGKLSEFPRVNPNTGLYGIDFGSTSPLSFDRNAPLATQSITTGPFQGFAYLTASPQMQAQVVSLSRALDGFGPWGVDQNGQGATPSGPATGLRWCTAADLPNIKAYAKAHEMEHVQRNRAVAGLSALSYWEDVVLRAGMTDEQAFNLMQPYLNRLVNIAYEQWHLPYDNETYGHPTHRYDIDRAVGCEMDDDYKLP